MVVFSPDGVHPYPGSGHKIYHDVFVSAFTEMKSKQVNDVVLYKNAKPLNANLSLNVKMIDWDKIDLKNELTPIITKDNQILKGFSKHFNSIGKGMPGDSISFKFRGKAIGFSDIIGPGTGALEISIDEDIKKYMRFDKYSTYYRVTYKIIDGLRDTIHKVSFKVLKDTIDKKTILSEHNNSMKNAEDYTGLNWYLGKVMIDGDLIEKQN